MKALFRRLLLCLAAATDRELARQVQYLKVENEILRGKLPKRVAVTPRERQRLLRFGRAVGSAINALITIVSPRTFARWLRGEAAPKRQAPAQRGRRRTEAEVRELVLRIARETGWGYTRILGELKKLNVRGVSRSTVVNILKEGGLDTGPKRGEGSWDDFVRRHAATLWACDFFSKKVWTPRGLVEVFVLFFLHVGSRRVHVAGMTARPDAAWVARQARKVSTVFAGQPDRPAALLRDHDGKFTREFDKILEAEGVEVKPVGPRAPNLNAHAERWVQSIRRECLGHFVVFGEAHLRHLVSEYVAHYNEERPHQGVGNVPLGAPAGAAGGEVVCHERLGGLLRHYARRAA